MPTTLILPPPPDFHTFLQLCETSHVVAYFATFSFLLKIIPLFDIDCRNKNLFLCWFYAPLRWSNFKIILKYRKISSHSGKAEIKNSFKKSYQKRCWIDSLLTQKLNFFLIWVCYSLFRLNLDVQSESVSHIIYYKYWVLMIHGHVIWVSYSVKHVRKKKKTMNWNQLCK